MKDLRIDQNQSLSRVLTRFIVTATAIFAFVACNSEGTTGGDCSDPTNSGDNCSVGSVGPAVPSTSTPVASGNDLVCTVDKFKQIGANDRLKKIDILFVMDTSGSMQDDWERVANNVQEMVKEVPTDVDARYAVILGHVGNYAGKLYSGKSQPKVLSSATMTNLAISQSLFATFVDGMKTTDTGTGEALFHSLYHAVTDRAAENQSLGFFRSDAALAVLFMSDEHEIGHLFPNPQAPGLPKRCDASTEDSIRKTWYVDKGIDVDVTYQAMKQFKGDMPLSTHAFVNITAADLFLHNDPNASCLYDSLGYGYFEIVNKTGGVLFSIQADKAEAMSRVGQHVNQTLQFIHDFKLSWAASEIDASSIKAKVDGVGVAHLYNQTTNVVHLENSGVANSEIEISYCSPSAVNQWSILGFHGVEQEYQVALSWQTNAANTVGVVRWGLAANSLINTTAPTALGELHSTTIANLVPDTDYYFQVEATDELGRSQFSNVIMVRTRALIVVDPNPTENTWSVMGLDGTTTTNGATIIWQTPGVATKGVLHVGLSPDALNLQTIEANSFLESQILSVSGLDADTVYYFAVDTIDANGKVASSAVISKRTKALP